MSEEADREALAELIDRLRSEGLLDEHRAHFAALPRETREFLANLRPEDISELHDVIVWQRSARTVGRITYWIITTIVGIMIAAVALGEKIQSVFAMWKQH
ncbi:hypothetical protein GJ654_10495 [Rhodoblastus acidophilus]|uniref:Uncharacterized protein n=1 Tax=Rhodoblastus acidophilus TaxID=1074 RepID=A0A6N8DQF4_RHOAC|nr:hypothetical protein [Rhodoblastus acidophilus]MCW2275155.1 hypothetical protein [Rhodoblastus acidophilus]MTV31423.1 hypothetical protein [Rhodoblastus acidophilus]